MLKMIDHEKVQGMITGSMLTCTSEENQHGQDVSSNHDSLAAEIERVTTPVEAEGMNTRTPTARESTFRVRIRPSSPQSAITHPVGLRSKHA